MPSWKTRGSYSRMRVARSTFAALWPTCSTSFPVIVTISPSTTAFVPWSRWVDRGCFSPRKFSIRSSSPRTWTFIGKCAATTFRRASTPWVRPPAMFAMWAAHVRRSACERFRWDGSRSSRETSVPWTVSTRASDGNGRTIVPSLPFARSVRPSTVSVTPFGISTVARPVSSVDIGEQPPPDLQLAGVRVGEDATVRGKDEQTEVLRRQESRLVALETVVRDRDARLDDPAGVDPPGERDVVLPAAARGDERELLDVLVVAKDPEDLSDQLRGRGDLDVRLSFPVRVANRDERVVQ